MHTTLLAFAQATANPPGTTKRRQSSSAGFTVGGRKETCSFSG
jgi:hypothetical protein